MPRLITERNIHRNLLTGRIVANHRATRALQNACTHCRQAVTLTALYNEATAPEQPAVPTLTTPAETPIQVITHHVNNELVSEHVDNEGNRNACERCSETLQQERMEQVLQDEAIHPEQPFHSIPSEREQPQNTPTDQPVPPFIQMNYPPLGSSSPYTDRLLERFIDATPTREPELPNGTTVTRLYVRHFVNGHQTVKHANTEIALEACDVCTTATKCNHCETRIEEVADNCDFDNKIWCQTCYDENIAICDNCSTEEYSGNTYTVGESVYCESCVDDCSYVCNQCDNRYNGDDYYTYDGDRYCESCFNEYYFNCRSCDETFDNDDSNNCETCSDFFCPRCWESHEHNLLTTEERRARAEWREPLADLFLQGDKQGKYITHDRFVGVEIEAERGEKKDLNKDLPNICGIAYDGSVQNGLEVQTVPASLNKLEELVTETLKVMKAHGYKGTKACGLHIHIDGRDIRRSHKKIIQVIKTFYATEDLLYSMLPPSRWNVKFCQRLSKNYLYKNFNTKLTKDVFEKNWYKEDRIGAIEQRKSRKYDKSRYYGLNVHSIFFRGTVELRYHSGTVSAEKALQWAEIALCMVNYAITKYDEKKIQELFEAETSYDKFNKFCKLIKLPEKTANYMLDRISKFNPNFIIKFNKGIKARKLENMSQGKKKKLYLVKRAELTTRVRELLLDRVQDRDWHNRYRSEREFNDTIEQTVNRSFRIVPDQYANLPHYPQFAQFLEESEENGFMKEEEVSQVLQLVSIGHRLAQQNGMEGDDIEE